ncbi:hypothetical protein PYCCODRAFT_778335 [Trametes coccinea BRFM310]|uniref:Uncharacterized protein n=1 Tax=Trametes coccinea (strain BRFM310) TaxID=1353009 RepID=A0A1Y2J371_TRAC3|nr:hypothetical protein PYCCODRAFT_778335 [Trametes coccinea BRFM310]
MHLSRRSHLPCNQLFPSHTPLPHTPTLFSVTALLCILPLRLDLSPISLLHRSTLRILSYSSLILWLLSSNLFAASPSLLLTMSYLIWLSRIASSGCGSALHTFAVIPLVPMAHRIEIPIQVGCLDGLLAKTSAF